MVHSHAVHRPLDALLIACTSCGTGTWRDLFAWLLEELDVLPIGAISAHLRTSPQRKLCTACRTGLYVRNPDAGGSDQQAAADPPDAAAAGRASTVDTSSAAGAAVAEQSTKRTASRSSRVEAEQSIGKQSTATRTTDGGDLSDRRRVGAARRSWLRLPLPSISAADQMGMALCVYTLCGVHASVSRHLCVAYFSWHRYGQDGVHRVRRHQPRAVATHPAERCGARSCAHTHPSTCTTHTHTPRDV